MRERDRFKRLLLGLPQNTSDYAFLSAVVRLAEQLELDLDAMFVQEAALIDFARLPGAREFRALGGGWHSVDVSQLKLQLEQAAAIARALFDEAVRNARIAARFNLAQGTAAETIASLATADDIIVVVQPTNPADRITQQFTQLVDIATKSRAAVLVVPCRIARSTGPVIALATDRDDPSIHAALTIAAAIGEGAMVVGPLDQEARTAIGRLAGSINVEVQFGSIANRPFDLTAARMSLAPLRERMIVMMRTAFDRTAGSTLAAERSVPVLLIEPERLAHPAAQG